MLRRAAWRGFPRALLALLSFGPAWPSTQTEAAWQGNATPASTEILLAQLASDDFLEQLAAKEELSKRKDPASLPTLLRLVKDERPGVRANAVEVIGHFKDPGLLLTVAATLKGDPSEEVRFSAVNGLAAMRDSGAVPFLVAAMRSDEWPHVRGQAALALSVYPGCEAGRALLAALRDRDARVQTIAKGSLRQFASSSDPAAWESWVASTCPVLEDQQGSQLPFTPTPEQPPREGPNPRYLAWVSFQPGSWVIRRSVEGVVVAEIKETLRSVNPLEAEIEVQVTLEGREPGSARIERVPAKSTARAVDKVPSSAEGSDVLTLNGQQLRCRTLQLSGETSWFSEAMPGGLVRNERKGPSGQVVSRSLVTDWEAHR